MIEMERRVRRCFGSFLLQSFILPAKHKMTNSEWLKCKIRGVGSGVPVRPITP